MTIYSFCIISRLNALEKKYLFEVAFEFSSTFHCWKAMEKNSNVARGKNSDIALEKNSNVTLEFSDGRTQAVFLKAIFSTLEVFRYRCVPDLKMVL